MTIPYRGHRELVLVDSHRLPRHRLLRWSGNDERCMVARSTFRLVLLRHENTVLAIRSGDEAMNPLAVPLCAFALIFAAIQHPNRELTNLEAWTVIGNCVGGAAGSEIVKIWVKQNPEWANFRGTKMDREWILHNIIGIN